ANRIRDVESGIHVEIASQEAPAAAPTARQVDDALRELVDVDSLVVDGVEVLDRRIEEPVVELDRQVAGSIRRDRKLHVEEIERLSDRRDERAVERRLGG